ncbi:Type IV leader peptidase family protein [Brevibacterium sandarakinum]|uniref:Type IV leader peptidase family protein n=1 Tax=Brevibacterium sandarakinum TaxID=629680 RepID=A0A1H1XQ81_BRESA|nr:prepilin peptidase [Brevibacterium sandarakinum]SDT11398.1 Type IV leader peptidase family protein [Brevibacterium sandarakinum]
MDTDVLHGMLIGLSILISVAAGLILARTAATWLADDAQFEIISRVRLVRGPWLMIASICIAAAAVLLFPSGQVIPVDTGFTASAPNPADIILSALILGVVAAATPFLIVVDVLVHRLPDRLVYPLIVICLLTMVLGTLVGESRIWFVGLLAGLGAAAAFAVLHLIGRLMRTRTMGLGDVKLAFVTFSTAGLFDHWAPALTFIIMMFIAGIWALIAAAAKRSLKATTIAFGPAMLSGMWFGSVLSPFLL